jgi:hypothetical protein
MNKQAIILFADLPQAGFTLTNLESTASYLSTLGWPVFLVSNKFVSKTIEINKVASNNISEQLLEAIEATGLEQNLLLFKPWQPIMGQFISTAFSQLRYNSHVIGPDFTGGYYILATKAPRFEVFDKIIWHGDRVFTDTVKSLNRLVKSFFLLPPLP